MILLSEIVQELALHDKPIKDVGAYNRAMKKGISDKAFFMKEIQPEFILDFGCADGALIQYIHSTYDGVKCAGYDISPTMEGPFKDNNPDVPFFSNWNQAVSYARKHKNTCVVLSSVIHEVYSYSKSKAIAKFWNDIFNSGFDYVVIRDTIPKGIDTVKDYKSDVEAVKKVVDQDLLADYEKRWGRLEDSYRNFVRFLLVYRYKDDWARESLENYMPLTYNTLIRKVPDSYKIIYDDSFVYNPIQKDINKNYGIDIKKDTHLKMIISKK